MGNIAGGILIVGVGYWIAYGREAHKHETEVEKLAEVAVRVPQTNQPY